MAYWVWFIIGYITFRYIDASWGLWYFILTITTWAHIVDDTTGSYGSGGGSSSSSPSYGGLYDRLYEDGSHRTENLSSTGYHYSNGSESWLGMLGEEHREDGTVVYENAYLPDQYEVYKDGELVGHELENEDTGITRLF